MDLKQQFSENSSYNVNFLSAEVRISSFLLILNVEYLAQIASVFATPPVKSDVPAVKTRKAPTPSMPSMASKPSKASVRKPFKGTQNDLFYVRAS